MLKNRDSKERKRECMMTKKNFFQEFLIGHVFSSFLYFGLFLFNFVYPQQI
jgi:hypothetical protein